MKTIIPCVLVIISLSSYAQSFEKKDFPDITTTLSSSRSANFIDVNGDGWDDIFFSNGLSTGEKNMLYINNGNGTFTTVTNDDIVQHSIRAVGASFADVDNDSDIDGYVVTWGAGGQPKRNYFYRNNGNGSFTFEPEVAPNLTYSETATWIDVNADNLLDLYITNSANVLRNLYFENKGDGSFEQRTDLIITNENLPSRSVDWVDYDNDGDSDLFITNEGSNKNTLYRNDGSNNFTQITDLIIVSQIRNSMGSSWGDIDNDGDFDLVITNWEQTNQLFINENGNFTEMTNSEIAETGVNSFGSTFGDIDNDGDLDLLILNSYNDNHFTNSLFINDGNGNFLKDSTSSLANHKGWTYSAAFGDYNNDGWLDVILANNQDESQTNAVFKNTGNGKNWIKLKCTGVNSNKSAIGAIVKVTSLINGNLVIQTRKVEASSGYASQNTLTTHFGLGDASEVMEIQVKWPSGLTENFSGLHINNVHNIVEGTGTMALNEIIHQAFEIYPNPASNVLFVEGQISSGTKLELISFDGKQIQIFDLANVKTSVNLSGRTPGIYFYKITENGKIIDSGKLIKY